MARIEGQKLKILVLADILARETDSAHGLTVPQLIEALAARGIPAERKSIYTDLRALEDFGLDVICLREGHICRWALASRTFEVAELKLLVDAVQSSKFLSEKKSRANHRAALLYRAFPRMSTEGTGRCQSVEMPSVSSSNVISNTLSMRMIL